MIGYNCKYSPIELLSIFDGCRLINNSTEQFEYSRAAMHPNICSHIKAMLEDIHNNSSYNKIFLVNCCDSAKRLKDILERENLSYLKMLDLPVDANSCAVKKLKADLLNLINELESKTGKKFNKAAFLNAFDNNKPVVFPNEEFVLLLGARSNACLINAIRPYFSVPVLDMWWGSGWSWAPER